MKYYIESLGCAKNTVDSERFAAILEKHGFKACDLPNAADLVLVNSCAFLHDALHELEFVLESAENEMQEGSLLVVTGCVTTRYLEEFQELFPLVNRWIMLKDFEGFEEYLISIAPEKTKPAKQSQRPNRVKVEQGSYAYLRISDGCDNNCSYCMIPSIRGSMKSVPIEELVAEAKELSKKHPEIIIIAQDTCRYGLDLYGEKALPKLIEELHKIDTIEWLRVMYMHPDHFEYSWIKMWFTYPKLMPYFEIPIQHASTRILKKMNRKKGYTELLQLFGIIKAHLPHAAIRTTIMVGHPAETKEDLKKLIEFFEQVDVLHVGVFGYSPEKERSYYDEAIDFDFMAVEKLKIKYEMYFDQITAKKLEEYVGTIQKGIVDYYNEEQEVFEGRCWFQAPEVDGYTVFEKEPFGEGPVCYIELEDCSYSILFGSFADVDEEQFK